MEMSGEETVNLSAQTMQPVTTIFRIQKMEPIEGSRYFPNYFYYAAALDYIIKMNIEK